MNTNMAHPRQPRNEEGFVLVMALLILLVLTVMGISSQRNTTTELIIAGNDRIHKETFYEADGATEFASEVLEQNIICAGFAANASRSVQIPDLSGGTAVALDGVVAVSGSSLEFWRNSPGVWSTKGIKYPADDARDMWFPPDYAAGEPHTNITVEGTGEINPGSSLVFGAGYLGLGRSVAASGIINKYEIVAQHIGVNNSESIIRVNWRSISGPGACPYN